ncbi:hypothetical protein [Nonomuraea dietziae]|uniref:Uncharacterized protein n=1 Tax=Nonomuraea dietziae TaxID=65515 RepID=A0A7W5V7T1_9ACTN|nr:hypothetical protein [Nonomuraea dietziae]MBB3726510.1 hypothetical protein [Nonomuraea dietziae]
MTKLAVTGHRALTPHTVELVGRALREELAGAGPGLVGLSCLAEGADQIFAAETIAAGGELRAVLPARRYRDSLPAAARRTYDLLLGKASQVVLLPFDEAGVPAYLAAAKAMLEAADELVAVWDGGPPAGPGGTADVVAMARRAGKPVRVIWPPGSMRA